ncbi:MAG: flagellar basal body-associated FliL family protein, partial [Pseudomonadota bacterium]
LADALSGDEAGDVDVDQLIAESDPEFEKELVEIDAKDFAGVSIDKNKASEEVAEGGKTPSMFRTLIRNLPAERKRNYMIAMGLIVVMIPFVALIFMGKILPTFDLPFVVSMHELTKTVYTYPTDGVEVPLFDDFRTNSFTMSLPKTMITLKKTGERPSYGEFEFFLNLRDKELESAIEVRQSEIIDLIQRSLEEVSLEELESPVGKERVKKMIRHRINEFLEGNIILGVYYRSILLQK